MSSNKELSNLSYTNKDFNSIYVELLEYAKKMSYRWDPSASDESDPGVVLLKLAAIIGDKNNYNIDKNVLELMPSSVTQLSCARQLFEQCSYTMHYYRAASGTVNVTLSGHPEEVPEQYKDETYQYIVPRFTMFSDVDNNSVFTSTTDVLLEYQTKGSNKSASMPIPVLEGTAVQYKINNDALITVANLDSNNRLYFTESNIAENGIFITNVNSSKDNYSNYEYWSRVDTLETKEKGTLCYKFGVSLDGSLCYIQFPDDAEFLFGEGINITYIRTKGLDGNIIARAVKQFYVDTTFRRTRGSLGLDPEFVSVSAGETDSVITLSNDLPITDGQNPETIEEAYKSYRRVKNTFDTLVTTNDYTDYMITSGCASNGYVCDRTNDIQHSYKIKESFNSGNVITNVTEVKEVTNVDKNSNTYVIDEPSMRAFDLSVYALMYIGDVKDEYSFRNSFTLTDGSKYKSELGRSNTNSLQHEFVDFEPNKILMVKNKYPITCKIIPRHELTTTETFQVRSNIETALYKALNSKQLRFGELVTFDLIESTILESDDRIKHIESLTVSDYSTWVYFVSEDGSYNEMRIDSNSFSGGYVSQSDQIMSAEDFEELVNNNKDNLYYYDESSKSMLLVTSGYDKELDYYIFDQQLHNLWNSFRAEIYAKNILCGVTPLYNRESAFEYGVNQKNTKEYLNIDHVTTNTTLKLTSEDKETWITPVLTENENILLTAPNFVQENSFSSYVKIVYSLTNGNDTDTISANSTYVFDESDFIIFFWKASDSEEDYTYIKYDNSINSLASAISPSFNLPKDQTTKSTSINDKIIEFYKNKPSGKGKTNSSKNELIFIDNKGNSMSETEFIKSLDASHNYEVLTGTQAIKTLKVNKIFINNEENGCTNISWILNQVTNVNNTSMYRLFNEGETEYTLRSGEYLLYSNNSKTTLYLLGEGTVINRSSDWLTYDPVWDVPTFNYEDLIANGIQQIEGHWKTIRLSDNSYTLSATEMQQQQIGPQNKLQLKVGNIDKIELSDNIQISNNVVQSITLDNNKTSLRGFIITYIDEENNIVKIDDVESSNFGWSASTILNINMSATKPQKLYPNQEIILHRGTKQLKDFPVFDKINDLFVLSNETLSMIGGKYIDLSPLYDATFDFVTYSPVDVEENADQIQYFKDKFDANITLTNDTKVENGWSIQLDEFSLLAGSYLFHITSDNTLTKLNVYSESETYIVEPLLIGTSDLNYIYKITVKDNSDVVLNINLECSDSDVKLHVQPIIRYSNKNLTNINVSSPNKTDETFEDILLQKLFELDVNKLFDYTAKVINGVDNPLESVRFLETDHFYNKYTICEWAPKQSVAEDIIVSSGIR